MAQTFVWQAQSAEDAGNGAGQRRPGEGAGGSSSGAARSAVGADRHPRREGPGHQASSASAVSSSDPAAESSLRAKIPHLGGGVSGGAAEEEEGDDDADSSGSDSAEAELGDRDFLSSENGARLTRRRTAPCLNKP